VPSKVLNKTKGKVDFGKKSDSNLRNEGPRGGKPRTRERHEHLRQQSNHEVILGGAVKKQTNRSEKRAQSNELKTQKMWVGGGS